MRVGRGGTAVWLGAVRAREAERAWRRKCLCPYRCLAIDRDAYGALAHAVPGDLIAHRRGGMDSRDRGIIGEDRVVAGWPAEWPMDPSSVRCFVATFMSVVRDPLRCIGTIMWRGRATSGPGPG